MGPLLHLPDTPRQLAQRNALLYQTEYPGRAMHNDIDAMYHDRKCQRGL